MRLAAPEAILKILGIQIGNGTLDAAGAALDASFPVMESSLDTDLARGSRTDYFSLTRAEKVDPVLRLTSGFVSKDDNIIVRITADGLPLTGTEGTILSANNYEVDHIRGVVALIGSYYAGARSVSVEYTYGFEADVDHPEQLTGVYPVVEQAAISMAAAYYQHNPANIPKDRAKALGPTSIQGYELKARQSISLLARPRATAVWPTLSRVNDV